MASEPRDLNILDREMAYRRARLAGLVKDLHEEARQLDEAHKEYGDLQRDVVRLSELAATRRKELLALKREIEARQRGGPRPWVPASEVIAPNEKRAAVRAPFAPHVTFGGLRDFYSGFAINLSAGGLLVATCDPPELGRRFAVEFDLGGDTGLVRGIVESVWIDREEQADPAGYHVTEVGLRFLGVSPTDRQAVERFAAAYLEALDVQQRSSRR